MAVLCESDTVPVDDSVASVTARFSKLVTWESAPSATCSSPTPLLALLADWVRALILACNPLAIASPAASSAPLLMRWPEDNCSNTLCKLVFVVDRLFSAARDAMLFRIPIGIWKLLLRLVFFRLS